MADGMKLRIAKVLYHILDYRLGYDECVAAVDKVLAAIKEPTGDMVGDVHDTLLYAVKGEEIATAELVWERMIETAEAEPAPEHDEVLAGV